MHFIEPLIPLASCLALGSMALIYLWLRRQDAGTGRMREVARSIQLGANAFLRRELVSIAPFVILLALMLLAVMPRESCWQIAGGFIVGAVLSMLAVYVV